MERRAGHIGPIPVALIRPTTTWGRMRGLLGRPAPDAGAAFVLHPCRSVHTAGMGYPIDVVFVNRDGRISAIRACLPPFRLARGPRGTHSVLEMRAGEAARLGLVVGMILR